MSFERHLENNLFDLHYALKSGIYEHDGYQFFQVFDSKKRDIYKAEVKDRVVHQITYDYLCDIYEKVFISDSYSSRIGKGTINAINIFKYFSKLSDNNSYVLKCDIRKYFQSVDQKILTTILSDKIKDEKIMQIIEKIISSFEFGGIPLGNVTSQIFANIYLNELDRFVKKELKIRFYIRYNDDFVIFDDRKEKLAKYLVLIREFLIEKLKLEIPENKSEIRHLKHGMEFLGYKIFPDHVLLREQTKAKIFNKISRININSKLAVLKHCNSYNLRQKLLSASNFED